MYFVEKPLAMWRIHVYSALFILFSGLIYFQVMGSTEFTFPDKRQGEFVRNLESYDIDYPIKVNNLGEFQSHMLHHELRKGSRIRRDTSDAQWDNVHYKVKVDNQDLHLTLTPNHKLLAPGLVVERRTHGSGNLSGIHIERRNENQCHFVGNVRGHPGSQVAMATCNGLTGLVRLAHTEYFIEPVKGHNLKKSSRHPHIIYKRSALPPEISGHKHEDSERGGTCGVPDVVKNMEEQRERWEKYNRNEKEETHRRKKRSISLERNVETMVVVDHTMMEYYKNEDIETYVLTIMNMVANMYHDSTIGNAVNIVLVRLLLLEKEEKDLTITHHADNTLASFCKYQHALNMKDDSHPNHHDAAILITRHNICSRMNEPCSTLGLSQVSGMCQPHRSCNINEDTGLVLAYTISHEIGHNFGMQHDNFQSGCEARTGHVQHVMSPQLTADSSPLIWSNCSRRAITKFLDRDWGYCLNDEPSEHDFEYPVLPPGVMYDVHHQCRLVYGHDSEYCDGIDEVCSTLWCKVDNKCMSRMEAAAQGSLCGGNEWCFAGECVTIGEKTVAISGEWSQWGGWAECSRTCGAGVQYDERICNNPPPSNGGKYCLGERKRYRICNTDACPDDTPTFRQNQCAEFNFIPYKNALFEWEPVNTPLTPCQLHCKPKNMFFSAMLRDIVSDGTQCRTGIRDLCISGTCRHVGCDWVIDSDAQEDRCGVCHGDGSTCTTVKGEFNEKQGRGYVEAMVIPPGARNIRVEEVAEANNYLAVRNDDGQFYLNGDWFIQWSGDYEAAGTVIHYRRDRNKESFISPGPLKESLHVMLLFQSQNPGVNIEYTVPMDNATEMRPRNYVWRFQDWSHCTSSCGGGWQRSQVVCVEKEDGQVDNRYCNISTKPNDQQRQCNTHMCPARWWKGPWQHCSVTCGDGGVRHRTVICVRSLGPDEQIALEDHECDGVQRPMDTKPCNHKEACITDAHWQTGEWSDTCFGPCSKQTREVTCSDRNAICDDGEKPADVRQCMEVTCGKWVTGEWSQGCHGDPCSNQTRNVTCDAGFCDDTEKPSSVQQCSNITCGNWQTTDWSQCTRTCGGGLQFRSVTCDGHACAIKLEPDNEQECSVKPCPGQEVTGSPYMDNTVPNMHDIYNKIVNESITNVHKDINSNHIESDDDASQAYFTLPPEGSDYEGINDITYDMQGDAPLENTNGQNPMLVDTSRTSTSNGTRHTHHNKEHHQAGAKVSSHEKRMGTSDKGHHTGARSETNMLSKNNSLTSSGRNYGEKNVGEEGKHKGKAFRRHRWVASSWEPCSHACGGGVRRRSVACVQGSQHLEVAAYQCDVAERPPVQEECNAHECMHWAVSDWSECSVSCGVGVQHRQSICHETGRCDPQSKPEETQTCTADPCVQWVAGPWSECSTSCGSGEQLRMVECVTPGVRQPASGCSPSTQPSESQACNSDPCPGQDKNAALSGPQLVCHQDIMSSPMCRALKKMGRCKVRYIQTKCCRTCHKKPGDLQT